MKVTRDEQEEGYESIMTESKIIIETRDSEKITGIRNVQQTQHTDEHWLLFWSEQRLPDNSRDTSSILLFICCQVEMNSF